MLLIKMICGCVFETDTLQFRKLCSEHDRNTALKKLGEASPVNNDPWALQWMSPPKEVCGWINHFHCYHVYNSIGDYVGEKEDENEIGLVETELVKTENDASILVKSMVVTVLIIFGLILL